MKKEKAITLISLVITIVVLIMLASVAIYLSLGNNGIFNRTKEAKDATNKQTATEIINLKITNCQMNKYAEKQEIPTLKELSEVLKEDREIQYVTEQSRKRASTEYNVSSENPSSIYTKLNKYPYEFEINSSLQLASIDGIRVAESNIEEIEKRISNIEKQLEGLTTLKNATITKSDNIEELTIDKFSYTNNSAELSIAIKLKSVLESGKSVVIGKINEKEAMPIKASVCGIGYYGNRVFVLSISPSGELSVRNASAVDLNITATDKAALGLKIYYPLFD